MAQKNSQSVETLCYSLAQFRELTSLSRTTVYFLLKEGKLKAKSIGRKKLITRQEAERFINELPE